MDSEKSTKIFLSVLEYLSILEIKKLPGSVPWWAQDTRARRACLARPDGLCPPGTPSGLHFSFVCLSSKIKNLYIFPEPVDHRIAKKSSVLFSCCFLRSSENMSSQDSDGESYVSHLIADPKIYGDLSPYGRTTDDEEDAHMMRIDDSSSEGQVVP